MIYKSIKTGPSVHPFRFSFCSEHNLAIILFPDLYLSWHIILYIISAVLGNVITFTNSTNPWNPAHFNISVSNTIYENIITLMSWLAAKILPNYKTLEHPWPIKSILQWKGILCNTGLWLVQILCFQRGLPIGGQTKLISTNKRAVMKLGSMSVFTLWCRLW